jgi:hypothetical protein
MEGVSKRDLHLYSKCYCVASVTYEGMNNVLCENIGSNPLIFQAIAGNYTAICMNSPYSFCRYTVMMVGATEHIELHPKQLGKGNVIFLLVAQSFLVFLIQIYAFKCKEINIMGMEARY